jgi:plastocyanin
MRSFAVNRLDSRFLNQTNCFSYHFATPGTFRYEVSPLALPFAADDDESALRVVVSEAAGAAQRQHHITVDLAGGKLTAEPARLEIGRGDLVTWSTGGSTALGFAVRGTIGKIAVDSATLRDDAVFTHAFGLPGEYAWADANGSRLRGVVRVVPPMPEGTTAADRRAQWQRALARGTMILVRGETAEPAEVEIVVGQTVFWAVQDAPGVSITDVALLG